MKTNANMLKMLSNKADATAKAKEMYGMTQEEAKQYGYMKILPVENMIEDPDNHLIYGEDYQVEGLAESIRTHGFRGAVIVYPYQNKYKIQSGHRTLEAAKMAGLTEIPVIITETPENDIERRKQLVIRNLNGRIYTPMIMAREIQYLYETYQTEREQDSEGKRASGRIRDLVAKDINMSSAMVERYRSLLRVNKNLQSLAEEEIAPWSAIAEAVSLSAKQQDALYHKLMGRVKLKTDKSLTKKEVEEDIAICKTYLLEDDEETKYEYDRNDVSMLSDELQEELLNRKPAKKINKKKQIEKSAKFLRDIHLEGSYIKEKDTEDTLNLLEEMKKIIDEEIEQLKKMSEENS